MVLSSAGNDHQQTSHRKANCHRRKSNHWRALIDRGANGCIAGSDMRLVESTGQTIDLSGIDDHTVTNLPVVSAGGITRTPTGDVIIIVNQAAYMPEGRTILSTVQLEHYKIRVDERPKKVTGKTPSIITLEGIEIPMSTRRGLPYIRLRPGTDEEWKTLPRVTLTSPHIWDPTVLDSKVADSWYDKTTTPAKYLEDLPFDDGGRLRDRPEDEEVVSDDEDRNHQAVDRAGIKAFLHNIIRDEIQDDYTVCNIEGYMHDVRWDDEWQQDSESESDDDFIVPPLTTEES